jgi:hypothetical protein
LAERLSIRGLAFAGSFPEHLQAIQTALRRFAAARP